MKCKKASILLNRYIDNELSGEMRAEVQGHLAKCENCNNILKEMTHLKNAFAAIPRHAANPFLWTRIADKIKCPVPLVFGFPIPKLLHIWITMACVLIVSSGIVLYKISEPEKEQETASENLSAQILESPMRPENMEKITLNLLVYTNGKPLEAPYVKF